MDGGGVVAAFVWAAVSADQKKKEILKIARKAVGHEVSILLPVVVRGERANYKFRLKVTDANAYHPWH